MKGSGTTSLHTAGHPSERNIYFPILPDSRRWHWRGSRIGRHHQPERLHSDTSTRQYTAPVDESPRRPEYRFSGECTGNTFRGAESTTFRVHQSLFGKTDI